MHLLDKDLTLRQEEPLRFTGAVSQNWLVNDMANGGYTMALMAKAMLAVSDRDCACIVTAAYVSPCLPGRVELKLEEISRTSRFTRLQASLYQDEKEKVRAWGTFAAEKHSSLADRYESGPPELSALEECILVPAPPIHTLLGNLEMRLDLSSAGWLSGKTADRSEQKGWISFREERPYDAPAILLVADSFPPPVFVSHGLVAWVPTIELSVNIRHIPQSRWLKFSLRSRFLTGGLVEADGEVWDEEGNLVSISRQIAQVRANSNL